MPDGFQVPMSSPALTEEDIAAVLEVLKTPYLSLGPKLEAFEKAVASYVGCTYALGVNSGTSGLHLAVIAAGIEEGDWVITSPFSFIASANCILYQRAVPVFVDIDPETYNLDPRQVAAAARDLTRGGRSARAWLPRSLSDAEVERGTLKAMVTVDAFGQPADYDALQEVADAYGLTIIEDACEALGAEYKGRKAGALGDVGVFAFYPNKQLTTGEGGMLVTDDDQWDKLFRSLRNQGRDVFSEWLSHDRLGYNYRLDEMSAALGLSQFGRIEELLAKREKVAGWYNERISGVPGVRKPSIAPQTTRMSWFVYVVEADSKQDRDTLLNELKKKGIPSRPYFTPLHLQPFYQEKFGYQRGDFPETEKAGERCLALPFSGIMKESEVDLVCETIQKILHA